MKVIVIPDLHGGSFWSEILLKESFDKVVFLGDYLDSRNTNNGNEELVNLNKIIDLKKRYPQQFFLLLGNHEFHYTGTGMSVNERSPRYQPAYSDKFRAALFDNSDLFQMAFKYDQYLFTHAGVTESWLNKYSGTVECNSVDKTTNEIWRKNPEAFTLTKAGRMHDWGDDIWQSPIWVRPGSLQADSKILNKEIIQVVGHTPQKNIEITNLKKQRYFFIDNLNSSREYLIINNGYASVGKLLSTKV